MSTRRTIKNTSANGAVYVRPSKSHLWEPPLPPRCGLESVACKVDEGNTEGRMSERWTTGTSCTFILSAAKDLASNQGPISVYEPDETFRVRGQRRARRLSGAKKR